MAQSKGLALSLDECHCLICMEFLIEPVTLPCNHTMCKLCFQVLLQNENLSCPFCRCWISSWTPYDICVDSFINEELWERIQAQYPQECRGRASLVFKDDSPVRKLSNPGELRKEYEEEMMRMEAERQATEERLNRASEEYIRELLAMDMEEERKKAEKLRLEKQRQMEEEEAKQLSLRESGTSPRKRKCKRKHCDNVPKSSLQSQPVSASKHRAVQDGQKTSAQTDGDGKSPTGQEIKTEEDTPAATLSSSLVSPKQGTSNPFSRDGNVGSSEDKAPKPSCSNYSMYTRCKNTEPEAAAAHSSDQTESGNSGSGVKEEPEDHAAEAKDEVSHTSSRKHTSKRKHQEPEAASKPGISYETRPEDSSDEEPQDFMTKRLIDLENLYFEKHQQEEQDRLFALELQRKWDEDLQRETRRKVYPRKYPPQYEAFHLDTSAKDNSKDKNI
ncbi:E3 ubiquitin-protein ligase RNF168-like [Psammomys obesus]|uniref:E3 ubiquitin-protein ligase RNF168-like n=1 Tax=Psammomys obesus TaxID=48139 RepID=UPI002452C3C5|nr:E3 ubiquitin-protein ligase RNF168-like [Psammomys obesus]